MSGLSVAAFYKFLRSSTVVLTIFCSFTQFSRCWSYTLNFLRCVGPTSGATPLDSKSELRESFPSDTSSEVSGFSLLVKLELRLYPNDELLPEIALSLTFRGELFTLNCIECCEGIPSPMNSYLWALVIEILNVVIRTS